MTRTVAEEATPPRTSELVVVYLCSGIALSGVQGVLPALPTMQRVFELSDSQISLVISLYFLPSIFMTVPAGVLADKIGRREVLAGALVLFGAMAIPIVFAHSFALILALRVVQGTAFAAVLPLTVTLIGNITRGRQAIRAQSHRSVVVTLFDATLPIVGGALAAWAWRYPFLLQLIALPLAVLAFRVMPSRSTAGEVPVGYLRQLRPALRLPAVWYLQLVGFARFFLKFAIFAFFPIIAASSAGMSPFAIGASLGLAAFAGSLGALLATRMSSAVPVSTLLAAVVAASAVALVGIGLAPWAGGLVAALAVFGFADGLSASIQNYLAGSTGPPTTRGGIVAIVGTSRNLGKFLAPIVLGALILVAPLHGVLIGTGVAGLVLALFLRSRGLVERLHMSGYDYGEPS